MMWVDNDLTAFAGGKLAAVGGADENLPMAALDGYSQGDGSQHVNFVDGQGHVHELYRSPDPAAQWVDNDLTDFAGAGSLAEGSAISLIDGYSQADGSQHVNYIDGFGNVLELYRSPDPAAQWVVNNLGSRGFIAIAAYSQDDGSQHAIFNNVGTDNEDGHIHELYRSPDPAAQWVENDLTWSAHGTPAFQTPLDGYSQDDGSQHVNFLAGGHVHELYRSPDPAAQWVDNDLTALAKGTPAGLTNDDSGTLAGYSRGDNSQHVIFIDAGGHVHELYRSTDPAAQWVDNDLTKLADGAPAPQSISLVGYSRGDNSQHVIFIDDGGHVHELYRSTDPAAQWVDKGLTKLAGGAPATLLSGLSRLDGYSQGDGSQHVNFIDTGGHVHELYIKP